MKKLPQAPVECRLPLAFAIGLTLSPLTWAQVAQSSPTPQSTPNEEKIELSPFVVSTTKDQGYFAENTLAGSRMRTNVADLASAITVVTKQQMDDTASLDINDVFRYELGTEGSSTYTPTVSTMRGDGVADAVGGASFGNSTAPSTNATANRVRGLGAPTMSLNYYPAIGAIPFDSYNTQSIEISRGPNSMLFGMGSPAGIVNQSTAQAVMNRNTTNITMRVDDRGSTRGSVSFNRGLIDDKLAIYGAFLYNNQQFERKPSYDLTRRQYGALTYRPFQSTTIRASVEGYSNANRRPNSLTPVDTVSEWRKANMSVYDAVNKTIKLLGTGEVVGPYVLSAASPDSQRVIDYVTAKIANDPNKWNGVWDASKNTYNGISIFGTGALTNINSILYVPGINFQNQSRTIQRVANGSLVDFYQPLGGINPVIGWGANSAGSINALSTTAGAANYIYSNAAWADMYNRQTTNSSLWSGPNATTEMKGYRYAGVTDRSIYDWENVNISQANYGNQRNTNYNVELDQVIVPDLVHLSAGWFRQDFDSMQSYTIAQLNAATLFVDTNVYNPDGSPNLYLGQVYVEDFEPDHFRTSETVDNYRAMIAFTPDFTKRDGWMKWLGRHQILGLASYSDDSITTFRDRLQFVGGSQDGRYRFMRNPLPDNNGNPTGWNMQNNSIHRQYYLSNPGSPAGSVTGSSGEWNNGRADGKVLVYNYAAQRFEYSDVVTDWNVFDAGTAINQRTLKSYSAGWTANLWNDRLVATAGIRRDINRTRTTNPSAIPVAKRWVDGVYQVDDVFNQWNEWTELSGNTTTVGAVLRPFSKWSSITRRAASGNQFWQFIDSLGFSYNKSDNFNAPASTMIDAFRRPLPTPTGEGKDYGFQFALLDNKLFARVNWFDATNQNMPMGGSATTALERLRGHIDTTAYREWLENIYVINQGYDPRLENWRQAFDQNAGNRAAMEQQVSQWLGLPYDYNSTMPGTVTGTGNARAKGTEIQVTYNPTRNWTIKFTGSKTDTVNSGMLKEFDEWYAFRSQVWDNAKAINFLAPAYQQYANGYQNFAGRNVVINNFWDSTNFNGAISSDSTTGATTVRGLYNSVVAPQYALAKDLDGQRVMGQRRYNATLLTNYVFDRGMLKGFSVGGAQRWADKAIIGYYGRASGVDPVNPNVIDVSDINRPIYDDAMWYTDIWIGYTRKIYSDKVRMKLQLNVADVFQNGELKPVAVNYDGSYSAFRIIDPRQFMFTASFDF